LSGPDIFISYARSDEEMARLVALAFEQEGFNVWWDAALHSGETFDEVIEKELRAAKAVVVLWSPRSVSSRPGDHRTVRPADHLRTDPHGRSFGLGREHRRSGVAGLSL
jgi:hypothetical protein